MEVRPNFSPSYMKRMRESGHWPNRILTNYLDRAVEAHPDKIAIIDRNSSTGCQSTLTFRQLDDRVTSIAMGLRRLGVERGDVVSYQLPNWWQFTALHLACLRVGAVTNPLMPIFRERELEFMLSLGESKIFVVPREYRGFDYPTMADALRRKLPALEHVLVVGGEGKASFEKALLSDTAPDPTFLLANVDPDDIIELVYTSGTTGEPKGALQTSNAMLSNVIAYAERLGLINDDVVFMASPMAHQTGFLYCVMMAIYLGATGVYQDIWEPDDAADLIKRHGATFTMGSTPFLADLTNVAEKRPGVTQSLRVFVAAGAPIPRPLVGRAIDKLGAKVLSAWGMTEIGAVTLTEPDAPSEKVFETDGGPLPGIELRIVDPNDNVLPAGAEGRLQVRGCSMFAGYYKRAHLSGIDPDGWLETGDLARLDAHGYVRITGRSKDIIIRGGENVPVVEIENLLFRHPDIIEVAIVAMPDARLGERACAFVVTRDNKSLSVKQVIAYLHEQKVAKTYMPERVEVLAVFPRTPSGKIQKFKLREIASAFPESTSSIQAASACLGTEHTKRK
jgi:cyclohexanecarboxylate-CoA ligase